MGSRVNRWGNLRKRHGNAHFLALVAREVAFQVAKWRAEAPEQWKAGARGLDVERLIRALDRAESLKIDPYLVPFVIMGAEWLFRVRPLTLADIHGSLDQLEGKLRGAGLGDTMPWQAALLVGGIYPGVVAGLRRRHYLVSLGQWAFPVRGWRDLVAGQEQGKKKQTVPARQAGKAGVAPALSPIITGLLVDAFAERAPTRDAGGRALAMEVASILRGRKIQSGDFGVLLRVASGPAPVGVIGVASASPGDLRTWLTLRWERAYRTYFEERGRDWPTFLVEVAHNPLAVFQPLADVFAVAQLYDVAWWYELSPRRKAANPAGPQPSSRKDR